MDWLQIIALAISVFAGGVVVWLPNWAPPTPELQAPKRTAIDARRAQTLWFDKPWTDGVPKSARPPEPGFIEQSVKAQFDMYAARTKVYEPKQLTAIEIQLKQEAMEQKLAEIEFKQQQAKFDRERREQRIVMLRAARKDLAKRIAYGSREDTIELLPEMDQVNEQLRKLGSW